MSDEISPPASWYEQPEDEHDINCPLNPDFESDEVEGSEEEYLDAQPKCICSELRAAARQEAADYLYDLMTGR